MLYDNAPDTDKTAVKYITARIARLESEKYRLLCEVGRLKADRKSNTDHKILHNVMDKRKELSFENKRSVIGVLVEKILVFRDKIVILCLPFCIYQQNQISIIYKYDQHSEKSIVYFFHSCVILKLKCKYCSIK